MTGAAGGTAIYAALVATLFLVLSLRVISLRRGGGVALGDGGDKDLQQRIRAHGNCAEYAPIGIVLLLLLELQGGAAWFLHLCGVSLVAGRVMHAASLWRRPQDFRLRVAGMSLTFTSIALAAAGAVVAGLW